MLSQYGMVSCVGFLGFRSSIRATRLHRLKVYATKQEKFVIPILR